MKITSISAICLKPTAPDPWRSDPAQEPVLLRLDTDDGLYGVAECNHAPSAVLAMLTATPSSRRGLGIGAALLGRDPDEHQALIDDLYLSNWHNARRGLGLAVLNAIDVALWDIRAKAAGAPLWRLLHGEKAQPPRAYLTLYAGPGSYDASLSRLRSIADRTRGRGYVAAKLEPLSECVPEDRIAEFVLEGRAILGEELDLFVDLGYRFRDVQTAAEHIDGFSAARPRFVETPLWIDDVAKYARLRDLVPVPLAGAEILESPYEFESLLDNGRIDVAQPWPNRVGISGTLKVIEMTRARQRQIYVGGWNATPIGVAAGVHVAAGLGGTVCIEHAPRDIYGNPRIRMIAEPEIEVKDGVLELPTAPGLGLDLDEEYWRAVLNGHNGVSLGLDDQA